MNDFRVGQRVRTTTDGGPAGPGGFHAPAGTLGVVTGLPDKADGAYYVQLVGDPSGVADAYPADGLAPAP